PGTWRPSVPAGSWGHLLAAGAANAGVLVQAQAGGGSILERLIAAAFLGPSMGLQIALERAGGELGATGQLCTQRRIQRDMYVQQLADGAQLILVDPRRSGLEPLTQPPAEILRKQGLDGRFQPGDALRMVAIV